MESGTVRLGLTRRFVRWPGVLAMVVLAGSLAAPALTRAVGVPAAVTAGGAGGAAGGGTDDAAPDDAPAAPAAPAPGWVRTWQASVQPPLAPGTLLATGVGTATVRMRLHASIGGSSMRLVLTNRYGMRRLEVVGVSVALPEQVTGRSPAAQPGTLRAVTFGGRPGTSVAAGAEVVSDPLPYDVPAHGDVLVSVAYGGPVMPLSGHQTSTSTSWLSGPGDHTADVGGTAFATSFSAWPTVTALDVLPASGADVPGLVAFGDSITSGTRSTPDANRRWPDALADMLPGVAVANAGIAGNRVVTTLPRAGDSAVDRLDRDVLDVPGVTLVVVAEGVNDIAHDTPAADVVAGLREIGERSRARGLAVVLATVTPFEGRATWSVEDEEQRQAVNEWIRARAVTEGAADAVVDLDAAVRDPQRPSRLAPPFDSGDDIHLSDAGYAVLAATVEPAVRMLLPQA